MERPVRHRRGTVSLFRDGAVCQSSQAWHSVTLQRWSGLPVTGMALCHSSETERPVSHINGITLQRWSSLSVTGTSLCHSSEMERPASHMCGTVTLFKDGAACQSQAQHGVTLQRWSSLSVITGMAQCHSSEMERPVRHRRGTVSLFRDGAVCQSSQAWHSVTLQRWSGLSVTGTVSLFRD
ncbi:hypothetical protein NDU88_007118 [Pleurodeles waltl]|uniref:Uncharacterized protein n=1 Tax=Pleurodeles waltl TaxID=8319 RepID=A0AAV7ME87_PLEWA|nr:hypothetical protein NDU88_007118 [Pleurodeles waltl]